MDNKSEKCRLIFVENRQRIQSMLNLGVSLYEIGLEINLSDYAVGKYTRLLKFKIKENRCKLGRKNRGVKT